MSASGPSWWTWSVAWILTGSALWRVYHLELWRPGALACPQELRREARVPTEIVLLSDEAPDSGLIARLGEGLFPGGSLLVFEGLGIRQYVDADGAGVLSVYASRRIGVRRSADAALADGDSGSYGWWTELAIPYGDSRPGRLLAQTIAEAVGGQIKERG